MISNLEILIRFSLALLWGGLVGAEREYRGKAAGFRTTILISSGACFFTIMSIAIGSLDHSSNPDRIASNIVTGIGFLGAGVIFRGEDKVNGITTAATIWAVAAVGMGIGGGYYFISGCASILILFVLTILPSLQKRIDKAHQYKVLTVRCLRHSGLKEHGEEQMNVHKIKSRLLKRIIDNDHAVYTWQLRGREHNMNQFIEEFQKNPEVEKMEY
jgi:putative Mg2+ transporter-C (MgtC) family protein